MAKKAIPGLHKRGGIWHIDKVIRGRRFCESTGMSAIEEAERYLAKRLLALREVSVYGARPKHTFQDAATKYLREETKKSLWRDAISLEAAVKVIGTLELSQVHIGTLGGFIEQRRKRLTVGTINRDLAVIRRVLSLAARLWRDENGNPWLWMWSRCCPC